MRRILAYITISALLLTAGCSTGPRRGEPAPVVRSAPATGEFGAPESTAAPETIPYPVREPIAPQITPYSGSRPEASYPSSAPSGAPTSGNNAVLALLSSAGTQQQDGDIAAAAATLERALRIEPRNAHLWHRLASLRMEQKNYRMAADLADKSNSLAPEDRELTRANWRLIARARSALGDSKGARQAQQMAR